MQRIIRTTLMDETLPGEDRKILTIIWVIDREPMPDRERYIEYVKRRLNAQFDLALREALDIL